MIYEEKIYSILKNVFGFSNFRHGQKKIILNLMEKRDVLVVMPTGFGKSLCYYIPAILSDGLTLVISPLISLIEDQVNFLKKNGVNSGYITSNLTSGSCKKMLSDAINLKFKILYVAPERLTTQIFLDAAKKFNISIIIVDEAHCISRWGHDFRPSYIDMLRFFELLPKRPVVGCFTATATKQVISDIIYSVKLKNPFVEVGKIDRANLFLDVIKVKERNKIVKLLSLLRKIGSENTIIFCATRAKVEYIYKILKSKNYKIAKYHAGLRMVLRKRSQEDFLNGLVNILVATNAFGMGVDKKDIRFIIHYNMPQNIESYCQEVGRAGRDGKASTCIMFYSDYDVSLNEFFIENVKNYVKNKNDLKFIVQKKYELLDKIINYCRHRGCYRSYILKYFEENATIYNSCGNCGNCKETKNYNGFMCKFFYRLLNFIKRSKKNEG